MKKEEVIGEVLFALSILGVIALMIFSLNSVSCVHGGPCWLASYSFGEMLLHLSNAFFGGK